MASGDDNDWFASISGQEAPVNSDEPKDESSEQSKDESQRESLSQSQEEINEAAWDDSQAAGLEVSLPEPADQASMLLPELSSDIVVQPETQRHSLVLHTDCPPEQLEAALNRLPADFPQWRHLLNQRSPFLFPKLSETEIILLQMALAHLPIYFEVKMSDLKL